MKTLGLSDPTKKFHSWWVLEMRGEGITEFNEVLKEKKELASRVHKRRPQASRIMDESFNAPITTNYDKWRKSMNRLDFMGVDTVPRSRRIKRIEKFRKKAEKSGAYSKLINTGQSPKTMGARGQFNLLTKEIKLSKPMNYPKHTKTMAHELSHALDTQMGESQDLGQFGITAMYKSVDSDELKGAMVYTRDKQATSQTWANRPHEQTAQFLANYIIDPRSMKREFPNLAAATKKFVLPNLFKPKKQKVY